MLSGTEDYTLSVTFEARTSVTSKSSFSTFTVHIVQGHVKLTAFVYLMIYGERKHGKTEDVGFFEAAAVASSLSNSGKPDIALMWAGRVYSHATS